MDLVRLIHFADLHLGVEAGGRPNPSSGLNQRIHDVLDRLDELCDCALAEDVDVVVFAGDAFKHQHPTPTLQKLFAQRIGRLSRAGVRVFLLVGNHDLPKMAALSHPFSIYDALEVEGVVVGERAHVYRLALRDGTEMQIAALPHFSRQQVLARHLDELLPEDVEDAIQRAIDSTVRRLAGDVDPSLPAVFAGHCHVNQADVSGAQDLFGISELEVTLSSLASSAAFPYYALGHIHSRQVLQHEPFVAYSGSLERVDFSEGEVVRYAAGAVKRTEAERKGFYRFDLVRDSGGWRVAEPPDFRVVVARPFVTIKVDDSISDDPTQGVLDAVQAARESGTALDGAFVKIVATLDAADRPRLQYAVVKDAIPEAYDVRLAVDVREDTARVRDPRFAKRMSEVEALERYLESREDWADERPDLSRMGRALIGEVLG